MDFSNLVIVITGASSDIGSTLMEILSKYNAKVIGVYNNHVVDKKYDSFKCDITNEKEVKSLYKYVINKYKKIDVLINGAALSKDDDIKTKSFKDFMSVVKTNLGGTFLMCKYASLNMDRGVIINMSSTNASTTYNPISMDYDASKAGIENLTKNLSIRLPYIKVCAIAPNWVNTSSTLSMDPEYLKSELKRINQDKLLTKEEVALKIIEIIINDDITSGSIIKMGDSNE